jgi:hypothetical protein
MILFLDTEFTANGPERQLLSLALVADDGSFELYGERNDVPREHCSEFVLQEVLPHFGQFPGAVCSFMELSLRVRLELGRLHRPPTIACDHPVDLDLLLWVLGDSGAHLVRQPRLSLEGLVEEGVWEKAEDAYFASHPRHHALHDARALRQGFHAWIADQRSRMP